MSKSSAALAMVLCLFAMSHGLTASAQKGPYMAAFAKDSASPFPAVRNGVIVADEQYTSLANDPDGFYTNTLRYSTNGGHSWRYPNYPTLHGTYNYCGPETANDIRGDVFAVKYLGDAFVGKVFLMLSTSGIICTSSTGSEWLMASPSRESPDIDEARALYDATYENGTFVAVGARGLVKYIHGSPEGPPGPPWHTVQVGTLDLTSVTFGQGRFVAVGEHSTAWYSADGVNWTQASGLSGEANFFRVLFAQEANAGTGQFVAVASEATVWYSSDGTNWTQAVVLNGESSDFSDVAYGAGKYVAVGAWNTTSYSTDGITWYTNTSSLYRNDDPDQLILTDPQAVIYDDATGRFIVVTADDDPLQQTGTIYYSSDGATWTEASIYNNNNRKYTVDEGYLATVIHTDQGMMAIPWGSGVALLDAPANVLVSPTSADAGVVWTSLCGFNGGDCAQKKPPSSRSGRFKE